MKTREWMVGWCLCLLFALFVGGARAAETNETAYIRVYHPDTNTTELQIALRQFEPVSGNRPAIWLTAASHIGDTNYYAALQKHLDAQTLVLFEGVNAGKKGAVESAQNDAKTPTNSVAEADGAKETGKSSPLSTLQSTFAKSLGLVFQLDAIDYDKPNFRNSDLSVAELKALFETKTPGSEGAQKESSKEFNELIQAMSGDSWLSGVMDWALKFIGGNKRLQAMTKLILIETLGQLKGDFSNLQGAPEDLQNLLRILIQERNKKVFADLQAAVAKSKKGDSISVFFGAGHMSGLEERITRELKYRPAKVVWLTAFSVNKREIGLSDQEVQGIQMLIQQQMQALQNQGAERTNSLPAKK